MAKKWTTLTGIDSYSDSSEKPRPMQMLNFCGHYCVEWRDKIGKKLEKKTGCRVWTIVVIKVGPRQYDIELQLIHRSTGHSITTNWYGTACCQYNAEAKAYQDYYDNIGGNNDG